MSSIWVNSSDEEASDEEEIANLCLVVKKIHKPKINHGPRARKTALKEIQTPKAQPRPEAQVTHELKCVAVTQEGGVNWVRE